MIDVQLYGSGVWAWVAKYPGAIRAQKIRAFARAALREAMIEWCTRTNYPSLQSIFQQSAWNRYGLTPRSKSYQQWQQRVFSGRVLPYYSPKRKTAGGGHMQELLRAEGSGFRVTMKNEPSVVRGVLTLPGARVLNIIKTMGEVYRKEFLNWDGAGRFNQQWIRDRAAKLFTDAMTDEIRRTPKRRLAA